ncbi:MAG: TonB-dependent receptor [Nitrospiraceae bacterium]
MRQTRREMSWGAVARAAAVAGAVMTWCAPSEARADEQPVSVDEQVTTEPVNVVDRRTAEGTGSLSLEAPSQGSTRLGLTLREIPASVQVITQQTMQERGFRSVSDAMQAATGVVVGDHPVAPGAFQMRGFGQSQIRLLFDGLSLGSTSFITRPRDSWNLDRIEILKGPASVLYGEGAVAGAVNLVTKRPIRDVNGSEAFVSYGTFNTLRAGIGSGGRLGSDKLHYRTDLSYQNGDSQAGIQRTPYTYWNLTSAVLYDVTPRFNLELSFDIAHDRARPYFGTPLVPSSFATQGVNGVVVTNDNRTVDARMLRQNYNVADSDMSALTTWTKLKANWQPTDWMELRNQTYYYTAKRDWMSAETYSFNVGTRLLGRDRFQVQHDQSVIGDRMELQMNHPIGGFKNRFVSGVDFTYTDFTRPSFFAAAVDTVDPFGPNPGLFGGGAIATQKATILNTAVFAEDQFSVTDQFKIVAGTRLDAINLDREGVTSSGTPTAAQTFSQNFTATTWRAGAVYDILPEVTWYGQYATAVDPVSSSLFVARANQKFDLATGMQWEVGAKGQFWNKRAEWTVAYFDIVRKNILTQVSQVEALNVGRQSSKGVEVDAAAKLTDAWRLQGNVTFLSAKLDEFSQLSGGVPVSRNGNRPPEVPQTVANIWTIYRVPTPIPFDVGAAMRYVGDRYNDQANSTRLKAYMTGDAWITVPYKQVWITLRGRNLFDKSYAIFGSQFYPNQVMIGAPRTVELSVMARF